jgi:Uma2 family endonuclease
MATATTELLTADEFIRRHGGETGVELVNGEVVYQPMPHRKHGYISNNVAYAVTTFVKQQDIGRVMTNDTFVRTRTEPITLRGADVLFISYDRLPRGPVPDDLTTTPELVFEIRSPSNRWAALVARALEYLDAGVLVVVLLDPDSETASVFRPDEVQQVFDNGDDFVLPDVLPGFSVPVRTFFE